jgi:hypothetical protein
MPGGEQNGIGPEPLGAAFFGLSGWRVGRVGHGSNSDSNLIPLR